jgi:phosphate transport system permease protein
MDRTLRVALWCAALLTIGVLLTIVGFIIFRGLVSNSVTDEPVMDGGSTSLPLSGAAGELTVVVNTGVRIRELTSEGVQGLFSGEASSWGELSGQDLPVRVFLPSATRPLSLAARETLLGESASWSNAATTAPTTRALLEMVAAAKGGIGWAPTDQIPAAGAPGVKVVPVRFLAAVVHPDVLALSQGRRLTAITGRQLKGLLSGEISNWITVGGPDLPVRVVTLGPGAAERRTFSRLLFDDGWEPPAGSLTAADAAALRAAVAATPGAVGICAWVDAASDPERVLKIERRVVSRNLTLSYFTEEPRRAGRVGGVSTIILNTVLMILLTLLVTTPIGVGAAVYLTEYTRRGRMVAVLRFGTETLAGIPSIIFGLFGFIVFVTILRLGIGLLSGTLTITIMLLPTIIRTSEEAIKSVPLSLREGSLALGATKWQTTVRVVVPAAIPGILTGVILAVGRGVGETAALLFTMGTDYRLVEGLRSSARVLSVHLFYLLKEGISFDKAFATGTILVIIVLIVNLVTTRLIGRMNLMRSEGTRNGTSK